MDALTDRWRISFDCSRIETFAFASAIFFFADYDKRFLSFGEYRLVIRYYSLIFINMGFGRDFAFTLNVIEYLAAFSRHETLTRNR